MTHPKIHRSQGRRSAWREPGSTPYPRKAPPRSLASLGSPSSAPPARAHHRSPVPKPIARGTPPPLFIGGGANNGSRACRGKAQRWMGRRRGLEHLPPTLYGPRRTKPESGIDRRPGRHGPTATGAAPRRRADSPVGTRGPALRPATRERPGSMPPATANILKSTNPAIPAQRRMLRSTPPSPHGACLAGVSSHGLRQDSNRLKF